MLSPIELRHTIHQNPELACREFQTTRLLLENMQAMSQKYNVDIKIHRPLETGLIVEYSPVDGPYKLFRADIDALPIQEQTDISWKSANEYMHACGHDVHSAILYGFMQKVMEAQLKQNIIFVFQPAEEATGGALRMIESGVFGPFKIEAAFALHVNDEFPLGTVASNPNTLFASCAEIDVDFHGLSSHVAFPEKGKNALTAARLFLEKTEQLPKQMDRPIIYGYGKMTSGTVRNIVPEYARLEGTLRSLKMEDNAVFMEKVKATAGEIQQSTGVEITIKTGADYREVVNNPELYEQVKKIVLEPYKVQPCEGSKPSQGYNNLTNFTWLEIPVKMVAEDFGYFAEKYPGLMVWLGTGQDEIHGLHNSRFLPSDEVIDLGIEYFWRITNRI